MKRRRILSRQGTLEMKISPQMRDKPWIRNWWTLWKLGWPTWARMTPSSLKFSPMLLFKITRRLSEQSGPPTFLVTWQHLKITSLNRPSYPRLSLPCRPSLCLQRSRYHLSACWIPTSRSRRALKMPLSRTYFNRSPSTAASRPGPLKTLSKVSEK